MVGAFVAATALAGACANGSSTGIRDTPVTTGDDDAAPNTATIGMPIVSSEDGGGVSTLPLGDGSAEASDQGTTIITVGGDDGGDDGGGSAGEGGITCAVVNPSDICGLTPQCGCASTQTCDVTDTASGGVSCITAGSTVQGDKCSATSDCELGLTCVLGACRPFCYGQNIGSPCVGEGLGSCAQLYNAIGPIKNDDICFVSCDLSSPSTACGSNGCVNGNGQTNCETVGTAAEFDTCTGATSCAPGLGCITFGSGDAGTSSCRNFCKFSPTTSACANDESCTHFSTDLVLNGVTYGFCE